MTEVEKLEAEKAEIEKRITEARRRETGSELRPFLEYSAVVAVDLWTVVHVVVHQFERFAVELQGPLDHGDGSRRPAAGERCRPPACCCLSLLHRLFLTASFGC